MNSLIPKNTTQLFSMLSSAIIALLSLSGVIYLQLPETRIQHEKLTKKEYQKLDDKERISLSFFERVPNLGFSNLFADWLYLRFIQYFGDLDARANIGYVLSPIYFTQLVDQDPRFVNALLKLDTATSLFDGNPKNSIAQLSKSLKVIPSQLSPVVMQPYSLWIYKGIDELLFLGDTKAAQNSYRMAADWGKKSADPQDQQISQRLSNTVEYLEKNPDSKAMQIASWASLLGNRPDKKTVERIVKEIVSLGGEVLIDPDGQIQVRIPPSIR